MLKPTTGSSSPLGATVTEGGVNFSVFSRTATSMELLLFDSPEDASPAPGRLDGRVLGAEDEEPVTEAEVLLAATEGDLSRRAVTGRDGRFRFDALPPGEYRVTVFANELAEQSSIEHVRSNEVTDVTYRLVLAVDPNTFSATDSGPNRLRS